jgi:hypothetical protein
MNGKFFKCQISWNIPANMVSEQCCWKYDRQCTSLKTSASEDILTYNPIKPHFHVSPPTPSQKKHKPLPQIDAPPKLNIFPPFANAKNK